MKMNLEELETQLKREQEKFAAIFYGAETPMVIFKGPEFIFEAFNKKYEEIYPARTLVPGKKFLEMVPELRESPFPNILKDVYETGIPYTVKEGLASIYNPAKGEREDRYFYTTFSRIRFGEDEEYRILASPREVTDRVMARKEIEENLRQIQEERDLRERVVSALSHDLRTPLSVAKMCAQLIKMRGSEQQDVDEMVDRISSSLDRADRMIRDLLDANRIKAGVGIHITLQECKLSSIVKYIADDLREVYGDRFQIIAPKGDVVGHWDDLAIHRMIENLAINAIKYGSPDSKVTLRLEAVGEWAEIGVHNFGKIISPEEKEYLFCHYNRPRLGDRSRQLGWGIGLSIAKGLVEAHKGTIDVESNEKQGTTFKIRLPRNLRLDQ